MQLSIELIIIISGIVLTWAVWISSVTVKNQNNLSALKIGETNLHKDMADLTATFKEGFAEMKEDVRREIDKVNVRLDLFLKDEITVLKDAVRPKR